MELRENYTCKNRGELCIAQAQPPCDSVLERVNLVLTEVRAALAGQSSGRAPSEGEVTYEFISLDSKLQNTVLTGGKHTEELGPQV